MKRILILVLLLAACSQKPATSAAKYHCPMHPTVVSDKPGDCPICGMKLVPIGEESSAAPMQTSSVPGLTTITITPSAQQRMGLTFGTVEKRKLARELRTSARIVADETKFYRVSVKVEGWVEKLFVATTGQHVEKGDPLLTIYSPDLFSAEREVLTAQKSGSPGLLAAARRRLKLWDVSDEQIAKLEETGEVEKALTLYAPASGFVQEKMVVAGQKVMPGESLMAIADLSSVWADADIYQSDLPNVKEGMPVEFEGKFTGKVTFISPSLDATTRTAKARLEIPNPDLALKPEMFGTAKLSLELGERLAVPETAVMRTGDHTYSFKAGENNQLIPVRIVTGARSDGWIEVTEGLAEGDKVVTSANFLVDSESSMKAALAGMSGGHQH